MKITGKFVTIKPESCFFDTGNQKWITGKYTAANFLHLLLKVILSRVG